MPHKQQPAGRRREIYSIESSLAWKGSSGATNGTYRFKRRSSHARPRSRAVQLPATWCLVTAVLSGGTVILPGVQTDAVILPAKPSMVQEVPALATQDSLSPEEQTLRAELKSYAELKDNWDNEGATAPSLKAVEDAIAFLNCRPYGIPLPLPEVASIGDVGIFWDEDEIFAEVQFGGDQAYSYYAERKVAKTVIEEYGRDGIALDRDWPEDMVRLLRQLKKS